MKLKNHIYSYVTILLFAFITIFSVNTKTASALTVANVMGYAWSSNIGWISFSSDNITLGPTPTPTSGGSAPTPYQVKVRASGTTGIFEGYAWSSNIGWISFNSADIVAAGCSSSASDVATIKDFKTGEIAGWAVALAGSGRTDGWDGCIKLAGTNHLSLNTATALINGTRYNIGGVRYDPASGTIKGFAWGGNVVGWVNFDTSSVVAFTATCTTSSAVSGVAPLTVTFTANPNPSTGTYSYTWYPIGQNSVMPGSTKTVTYAYGSPGTYNPIVLIADTTIDPNNQYAASCPAITVTPPPSTQTLNLYLVPNVSSPTAAPNTTQLSSARSAPADNVITMRRGSVALMGLDVAGYSDCLPFNADGSASWNGIFPNQDVENLVSNDLQNGNYINVDTSNLVSGTIYSARVQCTETSTGLIRYDYVKFKVTSSKLNEF